MLTNKVTLLIDDMWLQEMISKMFNFAEDDEILHILDRTEVEICDDCQNYLTSDNEVVMDVFKCPDQQEFCLNCCACPEHGEAWV